MSPTVPSSASSRSTTSHGLDGVASIGRLRLINTSVLTSFGALPALESLGDVELEYLDLLPSLESFPDIDTVGELHGVQEVHGNVRVAYNGLAAAEAQALIDAIGEANISGTITLDE